MLKQLSLLLACLALGACGVGLGGAGLTDAQKVRVSQVQAAYDRDFRSAIASDGLDAGAGRFSRTLSLIDAGTSGQATPVTAFYTLLEGLIYLQTGQLGQAKLVSSEIDQSVASLSADGIARRNAVLAANFSDLVAGAEAVESLGAVTGNGSADQATRVSIANTITRDTARVTRRLCSSGLNDNGPAFVAAYQASFLVQADRALARACVPTVTNAAACAGFLNDRAQLQTARNLLARFGGSIASTSDITRVRREIDRNLTQSQDGAPLAPPLDPC